MDEKEIERLLAPMFRIPKKERETVCAQEAGSKNWNVCTTSPPIARRMLRAGHVPVRQKGETLEFLLPPKGVTIRSPKKGEPAAALQAPPVDDTLDDDLDNDLDDDALS